jgi:hypothetical protein
MNRRHFIKTTVTAGCGLAAIGRTFGEETNSTGSDKLILSAPLTHSDWMLKPGIAWGDAGVKHMLDVCKACGWSRIYWRALDGGRSLYQSKLMRPQGRWDDDSFWDPKSEADKQFSQRFSGNLPVEKRTEIRDKLYALDYAHFDSLRAAVDYGHKIGLQIHAWVSINEDDHGWGIQSEFSKKRPQFRWVHRDGRAYRSQMSFVFPEVRKYKLAILKELLSNYEIDGLFLDWIRTGDVRDNPQTDGDGVADNGYELPLVKAYKTTHGKDPHEIPNGDESWVRMRAQPQTEFMREARKLASAQKRKMPIAVMVSHPWHYRGEMNKIDGNMRGLLLDVNTWAREGLMDAAVAAGYYRNGGTPEMAFRALKKETGGRVDVWSYAWVPQSVGDFQRDFALAQNMSAKEILFWEADYIDDRAQAAELKKAMSGKAQW